MPTRPPVHRPEGYGARARARVERDRERQALRPGSVERGYDDDWRQARAAHLAKFPWCSVQGCRSPATDVDHVQSVQDRPDLRLDPSNFRSMCHSHHAQRTARDQGFARSGSLNPMNATVERGARHPEWLRKTVVPLTLIAGPPGAGRAAYVRERAGAHDMVLDLDVIIAKLSGFSMWMAPSGWRDAALRWRNSRLSLISHVTSRWPAAWLILLEPTAARRQWWVDKLGARVVVLETPADECGERITRDRPASVARQHVEVARWWWDHYERRDDDLIVRPNVRATTGRALGPALRA